MPPFIFGIDAGRRAAPANQLLRHQQPPAEPSSDVAFVASRNGHPVTIRRLGAEDAPLLIDLHRTLLEDSRRLHSLPEPKWHERAAHERLARMFNFDCERDITLVAEHVSPAGEQAIVGMGWLGRARAFRGAAELSLLVCDAWQGCGIGTQLAAQLLSVARRSGIACVEAELLRANVRMLQLCARAGFTFADDGSGGVRATWSLPFGS